MILAFGLMYLWAGFTVSVLEYCCGVFDSEPLVTQIDIALVAIFLWPIMLPYLIYHLLKK